MTKDSLTFKQNGNSITMSDEQVYTKETLPEVYNSLKVHLQQLDNQINQNKASRDQADKNVKGLTSDRETLAGRVETIEKFAAKAHIPLNTLEDSPKHNPQAAAKDSMKKMIKEILEEIAEEKAAESKSEE